MIPVGFVPFLLRKRRKLKILDALADATDARLANKQSSLSNVENRCLGELLDVLENDTRWVRTLSMGAGSRGALCKLYAELVAHGGAKRVEGCQVAGAALIDYSALRYLLNRPRAKTEEKVSDLIKYFATGILVMVNDAIEPLQAEELEMRLEESSDEAVSVTDGQDAQGAPDEPTTQKTRFFMRPIHLMLWAWKQKKLVGLEMQGRWDELYAEAKAASEHIRRSLGEDDANTLTFLAAAQRAQGKYSHAARTLERARRLAEAMCEVTGKSARGHEIAAVGECHHQLAQGWLLMNDWDRARGAAEEALDWFDKAAGKFILTEEHRLKVDRSRGDCLDLLAETHAADKGLAEAEPLYRAAYNYRCERFGPTHVLTATSLCNLACLLRDTGRVDAAEPLFEGARRILESIPGIKDPGLSRVLYEQAVHWLRCGSLDKAEGNLRQCLALLDDSSSLNLIGVHFRLAIVGSRTDRPDLAIVHLERAGELLGGIVRQIMSVASERQRTAFLLSVGSYTEMFTSFVLEYLRNDPRAALLLMTILLRNKSLGAEVFAAQRSIILAGRRPDLTPKLKRLTRLRTRIAEVELTRPGKSSRPHGVLRKWEAECERLEQELSREMEDIQRSYTDISCESVARVLPKGAVLIELFCGRHYDLEHDRPRESQRYVALVLCAEDSSKVNIVDLGEAAEIDRLMIDYQAFLHRESGRTRDLDAPLSPEGIDTGEELSGRLFAPIREFLDGVERIFVCPAGNLVRQSFEVLPDGSAGYLLDRYDITYLSSGRELLCGWPGDPKRSSPPLVVAHPNYDLGSEDDDAAETRGLAGEPKTQSRDLPSSKRFKPLPGTKKEGQEVAQALGVQPLLGDDALEGRVKATVSPRILHIATHGVFLEDIPSGDADEHAEWDITSKNIARLSTYENPLLRSFLAMAGANSFLDGRELPLEAEDGILNAVDVSGLDLIDTELVVLSACSTGVGVASFGEGVIGLRRAFAIAGTKALVMSLWNVPDEETRMLMARFYEELERTGSPTRSLLVARRELRTAGKISAYTWGAFICQGDIPAGGF
jgi:CHAT domain-containing protein/tetratricopeptide (TPR) repeat protein